MTLLWFIRIVWGLNIEDVALHIALILRHCLPSLNHMKGAISSTVPRGRRLRGD